MEGEGSAGEGAATDVAEEDGGTGPLPPPFRKIGLRSGKFPFVGTDCRLLVAPLTARRRLCFSVGVAPAIARTLAQNFGVNLYRFEV